jgi:hypothetical protein
MPGMVISVSETLTQKCGLTELEDDTDNADVVYRFKSFLPSRGKSGTSAETYGVGVVQITASAG